MQPGTTPIFHYQIWHLSASLFSLLFFAWIIPYDPELTRGALYGIPTSVWLWIAILIPILHQLYVALIWRLELHTRIFSRRWGMERAFRGYAIGFSILFVSRLIALVFLAYSNADTLPIDPVWAWVLTAVITPLVLYLAYSVKRYFTIRRAYGIDHFDPEYRVPFVRRGIFRYTRNGMYLIGLMILYLPGLLLHSEAALIVALFNHLYIWVHYFTVELPDIQYIYGSAP